VGALGRGRLGRRAGWRVDSTVDVSASASARGHVGGLARGGGGGGEFCFTALGCLVGAQGGPELGLYTCNLHDGYIYMVGIKTGLLAGVAASSLGSCECFMCLLCCGLRVLCLSGFREGMVGYGVW
jgi:hypothetical protein